MGKHLELLDVGGCYKITDTGVREVCRRSPALTHLSLSQCFNLSDACLEYVFTMLPSLRSLDVHSCPFKSVAKLLIVHDRRYLNHLSFLDLGSCRHVPSDEVEALRLLRPSLYIVH